jgi:hypothetical protein
VTSPADQPRDYHPVVDGQVDTSVTVTGYRLRPDTWIELAAWCDGRRFIDEAGNQAVDLGSGVEGDIARLGDVVILDASGAYQVQRADGFSLRYRPAELSA